MSFTNDKPIYLQMADRLCDEILAGTYKDDDRIPSVREYAVMLEVNTNTAVNHPRCPPADYAGAPPPLHGAAVARPLPPNAPVGY